MRLFMVTLMSFLIYTLILSTDVILDIIMLKF